MNTPLYDTGLSRFFQTLVNWPKTVVVLSLLVMGLTLSFLPGLTKDTRADAFLAPDNPALLYKEKVKEEFGLSDPLVIALVNEGEGGIFNPESLALVNWITNEVELLTNINSDRVVSLATEKNIVGTEFGMDVEDFFDPVPSTQADADLLRQAIDDFPLYKGSIVAKDGNATLVVAEMIDELVAEKTYAEILAIVDRAPLSPGDELHVAGEGAVLGFLGSYIDADAQRLNPLAGLIITLIIIFAFRRFSPALSGNIIIAASVLMTLSVMAASNVAFFVITNALPVILIGISVADAIHIYSHYFDLQAEQPLKNRKELVVETMLDMWRPVTLTTLTTMAGFLGLYFAAYMPPFKYFGLFTAFGVFVAGVYSLIFLPAAMVLTKAQVSQHFIRQREAGSSELFAKAISGLGYLTRNYSKTIISVFAVSAIAGVYSASHLVVDENRINTFDTSESIYIADKAINAHLDGTNTLDIVIETAQVEDLFLPANLEKMQSLQIYAESLPYVQGSTSIVDYLKQMNRALNGGDISEYKLPISDALTAQYFLLYSASSDPTDFEEEIDYNYQKANIRINLNSGSYQHTKGVVESLDAYITDEFNTESINATLSGRVNLNYHWIKDLGESHFLGVSIALFLVWMVSALLFQSSLAGLFTLIPVLASILLVYSAMVVLGINLGIGTSMFASVAIGLGVDFSIHTLDRLRTLSRNTGSDINLALERFYPSTGRALLFNFLAISCGFGVLMSSKVVPLNNFGTIVVLSVTTSFLASMTLLPAMLKVFKPDFLSAKQESATTQGVGLARVVTTVLAVALAAYLLLPNSAQAAESLSADQIVQRINNVDDGEHVTRRLVMNLTDRRGRERIRETFGYRKYFDEEKRSVLFYESPSNVKDTAFLTWDYPDTKIDDDQWLYLPAIRRVRRISAGDRGDYFLGTDFTFEDMKLEGRMEPADYDYALLGEETIDGVASYKLASTPKNTEVAKELGYGRTEFWVDKSNWMVIKADYWDTKDVLLKSLVMSDIRKIDGIWTRHKLELSNHKTGHRSQFIFSDVDYLSPVEDDVFTQRAIARGL
jgi:predicted RND superfamily exporter protein